MMKKIFLGLFLVLLLMSVVEARVIERVGPYPGGGWGQNQYYTVVLDGEGEAAVLAKIDLRNWEDRKVREIILEIPGRVRMIRAIQEVKIREKKCGRWEDDKCLNWYDHWRWEYKKLDWEESWLSESVVYTFDLAEELEEGEETSVILYYKAKGYVEESLGIFNFKFKTIKQAIDVDSVRVSISVQEGYYLKGGKAEVKYQPDFMTFVVKEMRAAEMRSAVGRIGYYGGYTKQASGLDPWESFEVRGEYAKSWWLVHRWGVMKFFLVLGLIGLGVIIFSIKRRGGSKMIKRRGANLLALSFLGGLGVNVVLFLGIWVVDKWGRWFGYRSEIFLIPLVIVWLVLLGGLLMGPGIYVGKEEGFWQGVKVLAMELGWVLVLGLVFGAMVGWLSGGRFCC